MRAEVARADRRHAVQAAARAWREAGAIDVATHRAIEQAYPDDRTRLRPALRVLAGIVALVGGGALVALLASLFNPGGRAPFLYGGLAAAFTAATELQTGRFRRAQAGAEYATALMAASLTGIAWLEFTSTMSIGAMCACFAIPFSVAAWRWGYATFAGVAAHFVLAASAQSAHARVVWLGLGLVALPAIGGLSRSPRWPPAHRRCLETVGLVFVAGAYVAMNLYSLDHRWIEGFRSTPIAIPPPWVRFASIAGTMLAPPLLVIVGVRRRHLGVLALGVLFVAASLATLRQYHPIGPAWLALVAGGLACLLIALAVRRWLDAGPDRERFGFTVEPLFGKPRIAQAFEAAATIVAMSHDPRPAGERPFEGGGGRSGGGGATGGP